MRRIRPVAFLAAWNYTTQEDRDAFTAMTNRILHERPSLAQDLLLLIQFMDRNFAPLDVDVIRIAELSRSHPFSLFLLQRRFLTGDKAVLPHLLESVLQMNKINALRAYYRRSDFLNAVDDAKFSGFLGDWEKSLTLLQSLNAPLPRIIDCLDHLGRYDEVRALASALPNSEERAEILPILLWAFFRCNDREKIEQELANFTGDLTPKLYSFLIIYHISIQQYDVAQRYLDEAIVADRSAFTHGSQYQIQDRPVSA
jgi:tetratricopeptide (TPR) repeat protein